MNKLTIIGNLTKDPELRTTATGLSVCSFTVAVNRKKSRQQGQQEADFFRVSAWRELGENCAKYLAKGRKVAVVGSVRITTNTAQNGQTYSNMDVIAEDVEFLSPRDAVAEVYGSRAAAPAPAPAPAQAPQQQEMIPDDPDELPF